MTQKNTSPMLSIVIPLFNEASGLIQFNESLLNVLHKAGLNDFEIIYSDDGSQDETPQLIRTLHSENSRIKLIRLSRNFGKESALTAGIAQAKGDAILTIDGDGQHPVARIPEFIKAWQAGAQVIVGVRRANNSEEWFKHWGSKIFHTVFNTISGQELLAGSTDYRLVDKAVQKEFLALSETNRSIRGLIDWLGFNRSYIYFDARARETGVAGYNRRGLIKLATHTFVSLSPIPLYMFGYLGVLITLGSFLLGGAVLMEQLLLGDPLSWHFTGTAMLSILLIFLVGVVLMSQGMLSLYIAHIHSQSKRRPLYVIDHSRSVGLKKSADA